MIDQQLMHCLNNLAVVQYRIEFDHYSQRREDRIRCLLVYFSLLIACSVSSWELVNAILLQCKGCLSASSRSLLAEAKWPRGCGSLHERKLGWKYDWLYRNEKESTWVGSLLVMRASDPEICASQNADILISSPNGTKCFINGTLWACLKRYCNRRDRRKNITPAD